MLSSFECERLTTETIRWLLAQPNGHDRPLVSSSGWKRAAVLVPLVATADGWHLLFIKRSDTVQDHKGQVAFPGGAVEPGDKDLETTALRETQEEIGLAPEGVEVLGRLPDFLTITNFWITPVVGKIQWPFVMKLSAEEVSRVFTMPLCWLADPANREERLWRFPDGRSDRVIFFAPYEGEQLWGATARMTVTLLNILGQN